jgi:hypothetical protein
MITAPTEKGKTMNDREKLIELIHESDLVCNKTLCEECDYLCSKRCKASMTADHLLANGVTFTPAVPGPSEDDPNIMELCFHNGERHMKEKVGKELTRLAERMPCITLAKALAMLEGL